MAARQALISFFAVSVEPLAKNHDRRAFSCGVGESDEYLRRFVRQHADANNGPSESFSTFINLVDSGMLKP